MNKTTTLFFLLLTMVVFGERAVFAVGPNTGSVVRTFVSPDKPNAQNYFGFDIATSPTSIFIADPLGAAEGAVYQFNRASGALEHKFYYPGTTSGSRFGWSVEVVGNHLLVGATFDSASRSGAVYEYNITTSALERRIDPPTIGGPFQNFGEKFAVVGNQVIISSSNQPVPMFNVDTGALVRQFQPPSGGSGSNFFGESVAVANGKVYIASPQEENFGSGTGDGVVHSYNLNTGSYISTFGGAFNAPHRFGTSLATKGNNLVVGDVGVNPVNAYLIDGTTGGLLQTHTNPNPSLRTSFGTPVASMGDYSIVSSTTFQDPGSVYFFNSANQLSWTINAPIQDTARAFGQSIEPLGNDLLVGAPDGANGAFGLVYQFTTPVPEPSAYVLALTILIGIGIGKRKFAVKRD